MSTGQCSSLPVNVHHACEAFIYNQHCTKRELHPLNQLHVFARKLDDRGTAELGYLGHAPDESTTATCVLEYETHSLAYSIL